MTFFSSSQSFNALLWLAILGNPWAQPCGSIESPEIPDTFASQPADRVEIPSDHQMQKKGGTVFRWTKNGWVDSSLWHVPPSPPPPWIVQLHPLLLATLILLLVLIGLIVCSKEDEVNRLFGEVDLFSKDPPPAEERINDHIE